MNDCSLFILFELPSAAYRMVIRDMCVRASRRTYTRISNRMFTRISKRMFARISMRMCARARVC